MNSSVGATNIVHSATTHQGEPAHHSATDTATAAAASAPAIWRPKRRVSDVTPPGTGRFGAPVRSSTS